MPFIALLFVDVHLLACMNAYKTAYVHSCLNVCSCSAQSSSHRFSLNINVHMCTCMYPKIHGPKLIKSSLFGAWWQSMQSLLKPTGAQNPLIKVKTWTDDQYRHFHMATAKYVLCAVFWRVHVMAGWLSVLYYKGVFLASMPALVMLSPHIQSALGCVLAQRQRKRIKREKRKWVDRGWGWQGWTKKKKRELRTGEKTKRRQCYLR